MVGRREHNAIASVVGARCQCEGYHSCNRVERLGEEQLSGYLIHRAQGRHHTLQERGRVVNPRLGVFAALLVRYVYVCGRARVCVGLCV